MKQGTLNFFKRKRDDTPPSKDDNDKEPTLSSPTIPDLQVKKKKKAEPKKKTTSKKKVESEDEPEEDGEESLSNSARWKWLEPEHIKDAEGNRPTDENYDPRTIFIPSQDFHAMTPMEKQFWDIKRKYFDSVIFFKKGKFYELYEMDADIGTRVFDLKMTERINMRMVGFPEQSLQMYSSKFVARGYKIGRVEQVETVGEAKKRVTATKSRDKIVERELRQIVTAGTLVDAEIIGSPASSYLLVIKEDVATCGFGFVYVDCSIGKFVVGEILDDPQRTNFETLIQSLQPKEILYEKGNLSKHSTLIIKQLSQAPLMTARKPLDEFWDEATTLKNLPTVWKEVPKEVTHFKNPLVTSAIGGMISYLTVLKLDELLSQSSFEIYSTNQVGHMILDGQTLINLEVFVNNVDGGQNGTLLKLLDHTQTSFGKRLFKEWICHPLKSIGKINERLEAIEELRKNDSLKCLEKLAKIPDLERMISRIHAGSSAARKNAVYFGDQEQKKMQLLIKTIQGFRLINDIMTSVSHAKVTSALFSTWIKEFPKLDRLDFFDFDFDAALENGFIIPKRGTNAEYDKLAKTESDIEEELEEILISVQKKLKCTDVKFFGKQKERYQLEIPITVKASIPSEWKSMGSTKKVKRFYTAEIQSLVAKLDENKEHKENILREQTRVMYEEFDKDYKIWSKTLSIIAQIDCLMSLSTVSYGEGMCRPEFVNSPTPFLDLTNMKHPFITLCNQNTTEVIPNDTKMGKDVARVLILTGPNMGGKSTLLRQTCIAIIMAQLGCWIPADACKMTIVDRIFTRIGANDKIMSNQSTFMVELNETSNILKNATKDSFVILDELGRGTSTFDGYAIAYATIRYLAEKIQCRTLFSTHYYLLTEDFENHPLIDMYHMKCHLEDGNVYFMYKFVKGVCQKSYGMNVAKLAGISQEIIDQAQIAAENLEKKQEFKTQSLTDEQIALYQELKDYIDGEVISKTKLVEYQQRIRNSFSLDWK